MINKGKITTARKAVLDKYKNITKNDIDRFRVRNARKSGNWVEASKAQIELAVNAFERERGVTKCPTMYAEGYWGHTFLGMRVNKSKVN